MDPRDACSAIAEKSYKLWLELENRTDDITIIIVQIKGLSNVWILYIPLVSFAFHSSLFIDFKFVILYDHLIP